MLHDLKKEIERISAGQRNVLYPVIGQYGSRITIRGKQVVDFTNWDFLGLRADQRVKRAIQAALERGETGSASPRLSAGTSEVHALCERRLAQFSGCESSLIFSSKNQAVLSFITALCNEQDHLLVQDGHQGVAADAAYLVNTPVNTFQVNDLKTLRGLLERSARNKLIFIDSVSPLSGEMAPLREIVQVAEQAGAALIVDESFALGTVGIRGSGVIELDELPGRPMCVIGDLSRGIASSGAFIAGKQDLIDMLLLRSRALLIEISQMPALVHGALEALDILELHTAMREQLSKLQTRLRSGLSRLKLVTDSARMTPIVCVPLLSSARAAEFVGALFTKGFLADSAASTRILSNAGVVRFLVTAHHTEEQIDSLLQAVSEIVPKLDE